MNQKWKSLLWCGEWLSVEKSWLGWSTPTRGTTRSEIWCIRHRTMCVNIHPYNCIKFRKTFKTKFNQNHFMWSFCSTVIFSFGTSDSVELLVDAEKFLNLTMHRMIIIADMKISIGITTTKLTAIVTWQLLSVTFLIERHILFINPVSSLLRKKTIIWFCF